MVEDLRDYIANHTLSSKYYRSLSNYPNRYHYGTLVQFRKKGTNRWVHSAIVMNYSHGQGLIVAEHSGGNGMQISNNANKGKSLENVRSFWIAEDINSLL